MSTTTERFEQLTDAWLCIVGTMIAGRTLVVGWDEPSGTLTVLTTGEWRETLEAMSETYCDRMNHALLAPGTVRAIRWELASWSAAA